MLAAALIGSAAPALAQSRDYAIAPGKLSDVLAQYAAASGVQLVFDPGALAGLGSAGLSGSYSLQQGFARLLAGSGYELRAAGSGNFALVRAGSRQGDDGAAGVQSLGTIILNDAGSGGAVWNGSAATVFETAGSVSALTTEQLETFRGTSTSDLLKSAPGLFSSESRASGGLDVNIRGLQGQGRVAITVDGTANSTSVYRGYQGIGNRSYVDPDFIAGVSVDKGPGATTGAIGGTIAMRTYGVDDIVPEGERVGARVRIEASGNSSEPVGSLAQGNASGAAGYTYANGPVPGSSGLKGGRASALLGLRGDRLDLVLGFSRRNTGNYHAGSNGSGAGEAIACQSSPTVCARYPDRQYYTLGLTSYLPGEEVLNTASDSRSALVKLDWRIAPDHVLSYSFNRYSSDYGESYPFGFWNNEQSTSQALPSSTDLASHALTWRWKPEGDLIDLTARLWGTELDTMSASSSGPSRTEGKQWGVDLGNASRLETGAGDLVLSYGLTWLEESTAPAAGYYEPYPQRWGTRQSASLYLNGKWQATDWLAVTAGLRHHRFKTVNERPGLTVPDVKDSATDYALGVIADVGAGVQLFATYDAATRMPSMFEAIGGMVTLVSPDLTGERAKAWEIGGNLRRQSLFAEGDSLDVKLSYFNTAVSDYIHRGFERVCLYEYNGTCAYWGQNMTLSNIDSMNMDGVELQAAWRRNSFSALFNATWYNEVEFCRTAGTCVNSSLASDYATNQIPPKYSLSLTLAQRLMDDRLGLSARFTRVGPRAADAEFPGYGAQPLLAPIVWKPYSTLDLHADYRLNDGVTLYAAAENVVDTYYVDPLNLAMMPGPGRTFRLGVILGDNGQRDAAIADRGLPPSARTAARDWTGFYAGGSLGRTTYGGQLNDFNLIVDGYPTDRGSTYPLPQETASQIGAQLGWNTMLGKGLLLGVVADYAKGDVTSKVAAGSKERLASVEIDDVTSLAVKFGMARDNLLIYGMAGVASAKVRSAMAWKIDYPNSPQYNIDGDFQNQARQTGFVVGAGLEYALDANWSLYGEYRYLDLGKGKAWRDSDTVGAGGTIQTTNGWVNDLSLDQLRVGVNYRF